MAKVLVAMSGGVDSSVAAALLRDRGHDVVGVFMRLGSPGETLDELSPFGEGADSAGVSCDPTKVKIGHQGCCSINDAADARLVAAELGIPFYVCNFKKDFGRIIDYFVDEYARGRTPNPCVRCNDWLKFGKLHDYAEQIGATHVASGHYARTVDRGGNAHELHRGADLSKDQSYVLFGIPRGQLPTTLFPIGDIQSKQEVRDLADRYGLPVFDKPDSQEICFVPDNDYAGLVERRRPELAAAGRIVDAEGNTHGEHAGQHRFTIGQRRGVGVALGHPVYVIDKDPETNTVVVGEDTQLTSTACTALEPNFLIDPAALADWTPVLARHRYNGAAVEAEARTLDAGEHAPTPSGRRGAFEVRFAEPQRAVTPGQAIVLYDATRVVAGGWISGVR
ncbi:MAG: tRNA 2-thiouridine(34) synthase MnmA [Planctomycetota bacterium]